MRTSIWSAVALALCSVAMGVGTSSQALAEADGMCSFRVSAPYLRTTEHGVTVVSATFHVESCPGTWQPTKSKVCVAPSTGGGRCTTVYGWGPGRSTVPLTGATPTYEATGQGCARVDSQTERCAAVVPVRADVAGRG